MGMANNIYKTLGANAQTLTILATVCLEDPVTQEKAKTLLDKALAQRPDYTKAVVKKADLLCTWNSAGLSQLLTDLSPRLLTSSMSQRKWLLTAHFAKRANA